MYESIFQRFKSEAVNYVHFYVSMMEKLTSYIEVRGYCSVKNKCFLEFINQAFEFTEFSCEYESFSDFCDFRYKELENGCENEREFLEFCEVLYNLLETMNVRINEICGEYFSDNILNFANNLIRKIEYAISKMNYEFKKVENDFYLIVKDAIADSILDNCENEDYVGLILRYLSVDISEKQKLEILTNLAVKVDALAIKYSDVALIKSIKNFYQYCRHESTYKADEKKKWFYDKDFAKNMDKVFHGILLIIQYDISKNEIKELQDVQNQNL